MRVRASKTPRLSVFDLQMENLKLLAASRGVWFVSPMALTRKLAFPEVLGKTQKT